ncbi:MAG: DNA polymerase III subunit epsilon [Alphaproteobacteria bacterium]
MREIVFDTETTGLEPSEGHRIIEIGALELVNHVPTGRTFQTYIFPERQVSEDTIRITGITDEMLVGQPLFKDVADDFLAFIGDAALVAHNAAFDMKFMNHELTRIGYNALDDARVIDTLVIARRRFPGSPASLDALCKRFEIDNSGRTYHGALLDSELLADVYLELTGGRQTNLLQSGSGDDGPSGPARVPRSARPTPLPSPITADEAAAHEAFIATMDDPVWNAS